MENTLENVELIHLSLSLSFTSNIANPSPARTRNLTHKPNHRTMELPLV